MKQALKNIVFTFTDFTVIYTPTQKVNRTQYFEAVVLRGNRHYQTWKVSHYPNRTNALHLINSK